MMRQEGFAGLSRNAATLVPVLMLPALLGALLLLLRPGSVTGAGAVVAGSIALAWYLLGGAIAAREVLGWWQQRRAIAALRPALAADPAPIWVSDPDGRILFRNDAAAAAFGEPGADGIEGVLGRFRADPASDRAAMTARMTRRGHDRLDLGDGAGLTLTSPDGSGLQLWACRLADPAPEPPTAASASGLPDDLDALPAGVLRLAADGTILAANSAAQRLIGPVDGPVHLATLLEGPGRAVGDWVGDVAAGRSEGRPEMLRLRADPDRDLQVALGPPTGGRAEVLAVLSDASAMKTLEAQFVQSQKMQAIGQLAGGVAHDFNNLLTAISGHCDLLMLRHDKGDPDYADLDQISQNANRAAALVGQLLAFSRKQTLKPTVLDLRDTLADLAHLLNRLVGERITLSITHDPDLRTVRADRRQLEQVLMNLVVNARDAMPAGGEIAVRTDTVFLPKPTERNRVTLASGTYVSIAVRDEGCGIPPENLNKIFEPFFTTKRVGEGTGLGLSTVYGIVKQTGGFIFCDSTVGQGTCFTLMFPAHEGSAAEAATAPVPAPIVAAALRADRPATVLLVEDEAPVRAFATRALRLKGFDVLEADSAEAALSLLADSRVDVDVFVTDVVMPGMDGPSWVRTALKDRPLTRVVFISGYTEDIFAEGHAPIANSVFLAKPFSLTDLTETVERHLRGEGPTVH